MDPEGNKAPPDPDTMDQIKALFDDQAKRMREFELRITTQLEEMSRMIKQGQQQQQQENESLKRARQSTMEGIILSPIDEDPENCGPETKRPRLHPIEIIPALLDVQNFAMHWPKWSDEFQVYLAAHFNYHLSDGLKLSILLDTLGAEGSNFAASLYDPQKNSIVEDTFDEVWWRLSELCDLDSKQRWAKDMSEVRRNQMARSFHDIEMDEEKFLRLIPHLSLCHLECLTGAVPRLEQIVRNHAKLFGVRIEKCCLEKFSILNDQEVFAKYKIITSVTLNNLSESEARGVLQLFTNIKKFAMHNMEIYEDISGFPGDLSDLTLVDCKIQQELLDQWVSLSNFSLRRLRLDGFKHAFTIPHNDCGRELHFKYHFDRLRSLSIKADVIDFDNEGSDLQFLNISTKKLRKCRVASSKVTHLKDDQEHLCLRYSDSLKFLATKRCITSEELGKFTSLECLWIMCPVSPDLKEEIARLGIQKVIATYSDLPPEEPNLIFDMLNEYCLLEITEYLSDWEWMRFGQLHWKVEMALVSYKYPRAELSDWAIKKSEISTESDHFNYIAQVVTKLKTSNENLWAKFPSLNSLSYYSDIFETLPDHLQELKLEELSDDMDLQSFFQRVNSTLRVLKLDIISNFNDLLELHNLREMELKEVIPNDQLMLVLQQNSKLRRIHIEFQDEMFMCENTSKQIGAMKDLRDLTINGFGVNVTDQHRIIIADLLARVGPQLTKLSLCGDHIGPELVSLAKVGLLRNIQAFDLNVWAEEEVANYLIITRSMTSLEKFRCVLKGFEEKFYKVDYNIVEDSDLLELIISLPLLVQLELEPSIIYTLPFELELRNYLKRTNRRLRINQTTLP